MPFDFIEIEDNFVPDYATDPYRRKHIRTRFTLGIGESMEYGVKMVHEWIEEYIKENSVYNPHIEITNVNQPLPEIQVREKKEELKSLTQIIGECKTVEELKEYHLVSQSLPEWEFVYQAKMKKLQSKLTTT